jgi:hypothetical protein
MIQMALFYDEFEPKVVYFDESKKDWISIRPLPHSFGEYEEQQMMSVAGGIKLKGINNGRMELEEDAFDSESLSKVAAKEKELEYEKIKRSIVEWSSDREVSIENIKKLPDQIYNRLLKEIGDLSTLTEKEAKN